MPRSRDPANGKATAGLTPPNLDRSGAVVVKNGRFRVAATGPDQGELWR